MKQFSVTGLLVACLLVVFSTVLQAEDVNGTSSGAVSQDLPVHSPSAANNRDLRNHDKSWVYGISNLGFLIGCGVIGYVLLRKSNAS